MKRYFLLLFLILGICGCQLLPNQATATALPPSPVIPVQPSATLPLPTATVTPPPAPLRATPTLSPATPSAVPAKPLLLIAKAVADSNTKPAYTFKVRYPQIDAADTPGLQAFNQVSEKMAIDLLASYQKNIKSFPATPDPSFSSSFMETNYQVTNGTHGLLSILFTVSDYSAGAAHPNSYSLVINFDLIRGKNIELKDLFLTGANYLQTLSAYCASDLTKRDRLEFQEGVLPKVENFQNWNITNQGLLINFDPYQVAAYAMGPSQVTIPYAALKGVINPAGPLAVFLQ